MKTKWYVNSVTILNGAESVYCEITSRLQNKFPWAKTKGPVIVLMQCDSHTVTFSCISITEWLDIMEMIILMPNCLSLCQNGLPKWEWFYAREINHHENGFMPELMVYHYGNGFMLERLTNTCMHHTKKESMWIHKWLLND